MPGPDGCEDEDGEDDDLGDIEGRITVEVGVAEDEVPVDLVRLNDESAPEHRRVVAQALRPRHACLLANLPTDNPTSSLRTIKQFKGKLKELLLMGYVS